LAAPGRVETACQAVQHAAPLLPARGHHRHHPLHEPAPPRAVSFPADPTPNHCELLGALHRVVRRWYPLDLCEGPQARLHAQDLGAGPACPRAPAARSIVQDHTVWATWAFRSRAIVKAVIRPATVAQSQALPRSWRHEVSSAWITSAVWTEVGSSW
jgi:hypothetical protein